MKLPFMVSYYPSPRSFELRLIKHVDSLRSCRDARQKERRRSKLTLKAYVACGCSRCWDAGVQLAQMKISSSFSIRCWGCFVVVVLLVGGCFFVGLFWFFFVLEVHPAFGVGKGCANWGACWR